MVLSELRVVAKISQEGWIVSWTSEGYIISKGLQPDMRLEAFQKGKRHVRYIQTLDAVARIMAEDLGITTYTVRGHETRQQEIF
jgi:hypothetical protein